MINFFKLDDFCGFHSSTLKYITDTANSKLAREGVRVYGRISSLTGEYQFTPTQLSEGFASDTHTAILIGIEPIKPVEPKCDHLIAIGWQKILAKMIGKFCPLCGEALS